MFLMLAGWIVVGGTIYYISHEARVWIGHQAWAGYLASALIVGWSVVNMFQIYGNK